MLVRPPQPDGERVGPDPIDRISLFAGILAILPGIEAMNWLRDSQPDAADAVVYALGFAIPLAVWGAVQVIGRPFRRRMNSDGT